MVSWKLIVSSSCVVVVVAILVFVVLSARGTVSPTTETPTTEQTPVSEETAASQTPVTEEVPPPIPIDAVGEAWGEWDDCVTPQTCGLGTQTRRRGCTLAQNGGKTCEEQGIALTETRECMNPCRWTARYIRIVAGQPDVGVAQVEVMDTKGVNVALRKPVASTSVDGGASPTNVTDGIQSSTDLNGQLDIWVGKTVNDILDIDLQELHTDIEKVRVYNRSDGKTEKLVGTRVQLLDGEKKVQRSWTITAPDLPVYEFKATAHPCYADVYGGFSDTCVQTMWTDAGCVTAVTDMSLPLYKDSQSIYRYTDELKFINSLPSVEEIKKHFNAWATDASRHAAHVCKGQDRKEVFYLGGPKLAGYEMTTEQAEGACKAVGAELATKQQLTEAWKLGADWCRTAQLADSTPGYPINTTLMTGCATTPRVAMWNPPNKLAGANCYGVKPTLENTPIAENKVKRISPFNASKWSQFD